MRLRRAGNAVRGPLNADVRRLTARVTQAFIKAWLWLIPIAAIVGAFAVYFARRKRVWPFAVTVLGIHVIASFALAASDSTPGGFAYSSLLAFGSLAPMAVAYTLILGGLVRKSASSDSIVYSTMAIHVVAAPVAVVVAIVLACYIGHDCL